MNPKLRIEGIYDSRTLISLKELGINNVLFDLRPKSFNFIQEHILQDIIKETFDPHLNFWLKFQNEKDFVVNNILSDLRSTLNEVSDHSLFYETKDFILEFCGNEDVLELDKYQVPFYYHVSFDSNFKQIFNSKYLQGIIVDGGLFKDLQERGQWDEYSHHLKNEMVKRDRKHWDMAPLSIIYLSDWGEDIYPSLVEFLTPSYISLPINEKVEICYRNVDIFKAKEELVHFLKGNSIIP